MYWTPSRIPELASLPPEKRTRAWKFARRKLSRSWRFWMIGLLGSAVAAFLSSLAVQIAPEGIHLPLQAIIVGAFLLVWEQIAFAQARPYLREVVAREAVDVLEVGN